MPTWPWGGLVLAAMATNLKRSSERPAVRARWQRQGVCSVAIRARWPVGRTTICSATPPRGAMPTWSSSVWHLKKRDDNGCAALYQAVAHAQAQALALLLARGATVKGCPKPILSVWQLNGQLICVEALIKAGAPIVSASEYGLSALLCAAGKGHVEIVKYLLGKGTSVNVEIKSGATPLMVAFLRGQRACVYRPCWRPVPRLNMRPAKTTCRRLTCCCRTAKHWKVHATEQNQSSLCSRTGQKNFWHAKVTNNLPAQTNKQTACQSWRPSCQQPASRCPNTQAKEQTVNTIDHRNFTLWLSP